MLYRICNNGRAVLLTREPQFVDSELSLEFDTLDSGYVAIFRIYDKKYYRNIREGRCSIAASLLKTGPVGVTVVKDDELEPVYEGDELYALCREGVVVIEGNTLEYDRLLAEQRCEIDELRADNAEFKAELLQFREEFDRLYKGYQVL